MMIQPNSKTTAAASGLILGGITVVGMFFNASFASQLGHVWYDQAGLVAASLLFDAAKVVAFCYFCHHLLRLALLQAAGCLLVWMLTASYGMYAAGSFAFTQLAASQIEQEATNKQIRKRDEYIESLKRDVEDAKQARNARGAVMWTSSGSCTVPTTPESIEFCKAYQIKYGTLLNAIDVAAKDTRKEMSATPSMMEWSRITGMSVHDVMVSIALIFALIMEVVASVSGFAFSKNAADVKDERKALQAARNHERRMAHLQTMREKADRRNAREREKRAENRVALRVVN